MGGIVAALIRGARLRPKGHARLGTLVGWWNLKRTLASVKSNLRSLLGKANQTGSCLGRFVTSSYPSMSLRSAILMKALGPLLCGGPIRSWYILFIGGRFAPKRLDRVESLHVDGLCVFFIVGFSRGAGWCRIL